MRVFVTGATGFVGSAIVQELIGGGHRVLGLARTYQAADSLKRWGAEAHNGDLFNAESLTKGALACDAVIHAAFMHEFSDYAAAARLDTMAVEALGGGLAGTGKPFIVTSVTSLLTPGHVGTEEDAPDPDSASAPRIPSEIAALSMVERNVRVSALRLPESVHGDGDTGFVPALIDLARKKGVSAYVGEGLNRWPAVHRLDAANLYRLALEKGSAGAKFHAVSDNGINLRDIATIIGRRLNVPAISKSPEEATDHFGWLAHFVSIDNPTSSALTRRQLAWETKQPGLIADIDRLGYF